MPPPVKLHDAAGRLAVEWNIPSEIAMQIVRGVLKGGECFVRGRRPAEMGLRDISKEISGEFGSTFSPAFLFSREFVDVEIDWNGLIEHGRLLVPSAYEFVVQEAEKSRAEVGPNTLFSNDELRACHYLAPRLRDDPNMKVDDALAICKSKFLTLSKRGFRERVWPQAREAAGLEAVAPPGPKPKINRRI